MSMTTLGDAARFHMLQHDGTRLRQEVERLTSALSTGRHGDLGRATGGDFGDLAAMARSLTLTQTFARTIDEAGFAADARQTALARVESEIDGLAPHLLALSTSGGMHDLALALADAPERFAHAVAALNTRVADLSLFAGNAPDQPAVIPAEAMLDHLRPLVTAAATPQAAIAAVEAWFLDPGGGFAATAWQGGTGPAAPAILGEGQQIDAAITAQDPAIRAVLAGLALAALAGEVPAEDQRVMVTAAATRLERGEDGLIGLRADLGATQARIDEARVAAQSARAGFEIAYARLVEADPYRTATDLQAVQARLELLYVLTARLSRLSLTEYL
jgi:flagellar hook-associated protein 3 FlgL